MKKTILMVLAVFFLFVGLVLFSYMIANCSEIGDGFNGESFKPQLSYNTKTDEWTMWNKILFGSAVAGQVGDFISTDNGLSRGCVEENPLFGESPNMPLIAVSKVVLLGGAWYLIEYVIAPEYRQDARNYIYAPIALMGIGLTTHNYNMACR